MMSSKRNTTTAHTPIMFNIFDYLLQCGCVLNVLLLFLYVKDPLISNRYLGDGA